MSGPSTKPAGHCTCEKLSIKTVGHGELQPALAFAPSLHAGVAPALFSFRDTARCMHLAPPRGARSCCYLWHAWLCRATARHLVSIPGPSPRGWCGSKNTHTHTHMQICAHASNARTRGATQTTGYTHVLVIHQSIACACGVPRTCSSGRSSSGPQCVRTRAAHMSADCLADGGSCGGHARRAKPVIIYAQARVSRSVPVCICVRVCIVRPVAPPTHTDTQTHPRTKARTHATGMHSRAHTRMRPCRI